jgi:hypothetical protein
MRRWQRGEIIIEEGWNPIGMLVGVRAETVIEDSLALLALYSAAGASYWTGDPTPGSRRYEKPLAERLHVFLSREPMRYEERVNKSNLVLLRRPDAWHSVWLFWDKDWKFQTWYVNLESPYRRTSSGIAVTDHHLDLVVSPGLDWRWKDEDEFEGVCEAGAFSPEERASIRAEGERVAARVEARQWPFESDWPEWRPDPNWPVPRTSDFWLPPRIA